MKSITPGHLKTHGLSTIEYQSLYGDTFSIESRSKRSTSCSKAHKGKSKSDNHRQALSESVKRAWLDGRLKGHNHSIETRIKMSDSGKKKLFTEEHRRNLSIGQFHRDPSTRISGFSVFTSEQLSEWRKRDWLTRDTSFKRPKWECDLDVWLTEKDIKFVSNYRIPDTTHPWDFYLVQLNLLIELDGCYWHSCPIHFPDISANEDEFWTTYATMSGYYVLRIWEHNKYQMYDILERRLSGEWPITSIDL
jgi:very-short-patch-repair endonuclease